MIVQRNTWVIEPGRRGEAVEMLRDMWKWLDPSVTHRIYQPVTGPHWTIIQEVEFEDFEARGKFWADLHSRPEFAPLIKKWWDLEESGMTIELLNLVE